jgi:glycine betaine/proline transport system ATP-binding protein
MKDGAFVQVGSPADILLNPRGDYVRAFVQGMSKLRLLTAEQIMEPLPSNNSRAMNKVKTAPRISARTEFGQLIELATASEQPLVVCDAGGPVGVISRQCLLRAVKQDLRSR